MIFFEASTFKIPRLLDETTDGAPYDWHGTRHTPDIVPLNHQHCNCTEFTSVTEFTTVTKISYAHLSISRTRWFVRALYSGFLNEGANENQEVLGTSFIHLTFYSLVCLMCSVLIR